MNDQCQCGEWSGEPCQWSGPTSGMVTVEWMPEHLRASHTAAGNSGCYPANGARRIAVERSCAKAMVEHDGEWVRIVSDPATKDIAEILAAYGEVFTGGQPGEVAAEWVAAGITDLDEVNGWCLALVWEPAVAAKLRAAGISPQRLSSISESMTRGMTPDEMRDRWTEGCPVYAACNGDIDVGDLIEFGK